MDSDIYRDETRQLQQQIEQEKEMNLIYEQEKKMKIMEEELRQKQLQDEYRRLEKQINSILPLINEANLAAIEIGRNIEFDTKLVKRMDPFLRSGNLSKLPTEVIIKVQNNEDRYFYEWSVEKLQNRLYMIREILEQYYYSGIMPKLHKQEDPFWDPPNPVLIG